MSEFAHSMGQFARFKDNEPERQLFFKKLLCAIKRTQATPIGAIVSIEAFHALTQSQRDLFVGPYYLAFQICTRYAALKADPDADECVDMVYSLNDEFGTTSNRTRPGDEPGNGEKLFSAMKMTRNTNATWASFLQRRPRIVRNCRPRTYLHTNSSMSLRIGSSDRTTTCATGWARFCAYRLFQCQGLIYWIGKSFFISSNAVASRTRQESKRPTRWWVYRQSRRW